MKSKMDFGKTKEFIEEIERKDVPSDPIILQAYNSIFKKLQTEILLWNEFNTELPFPKPSGQIDNEKYNSGNDDHTTDLHAMCFDDKGNRKKLNKQQLKDIANTGRFTVKSTIGDTYNNVWLLGSFFQLGVEEIKRRLKVRSKKAKKHWFLYLPEYFDNSSSNSLQQIIKNIGNCFPHLFRVIFGMKEYRPRYSDWTIKYFLQKENLLFLFSNTSVDADNKYIWLNDDLNNLNVMLADQDIRSHLLKIIVKIEKELTETGDLLDVDMLSAVLQNKEVALIDPELPQLIEKLHSFYFYLSENNPQFDVLFEEEMSIRHALLKEKFPYRGRYESWRKTKLRQQYSDITKNVRKQLAKELHLMLEEGQEKYFLNKNITYLDSNKEIKKLNLCSQSRVSKVFNFSRIRWSFKALKINDRLDVAKSHIATNKLFWRVLYYTKLAFTHASNSCLKFSRAWLYSPLGIKSVFTFSKEKFSGEMWLSDEGQPIGTDMFSTHVTTVYEQWSLLRKHRKDFEAKSDFGLFPRSVGRLINRFYCYVMMGLIGTTIMLAVHYIGFIIFSSAILLLLLLSPLWAPLYAIMKFTLNMLFVDSVGPSQYYNGRFIKPYKVFSPILTTVFYHFLIRGVAVLLVGIFGILLHIVMTPILVTLSVIAYVFRSIWDVSVRILFIYPFARIPGDNFPGVITRISGYGLASEVLTVVSYEEALDKYAHSLKGIILDEYESLVMEQLNRFNTKLDELSTNTYRSILEDNLYTIEESLIENIKPYKSKIRHNLEQYRRNLSDSQSQYNAYYIRLSKNQLSNFLTESEKHIKDVVSDYLLSYMSEGKKAAFWLNYGVDSNDWSQLNKVILSKVFSADIFTPIEDCDDSISVRLNEQNVVNSLLIEKTPSAKVIFDVESNASYPSVAKNLVFSKNDFWHTLHERMYIQYHLIVNGYIYYE